MSYRWWTEIRRKGRMLRDAIKRAGIPVVTIRLSRVPRIDLGSYPRWGS